MSGSEAQSNTEFPHGLKEEGVGDSFNSQDYLNSLSHTQQLDFLLDQLEIKYGLDVSPSSKSVSIVAFPDDNNNIEESSSLGLVNCNNGVDKETDMKLWGIAKRIKKRNEAYRTVAKILRELQHSSKALGTKKPFEENDTQSTSSCSSEETVKRDEEIEKAKGNINSKSAIVARKTATTTPTTSTTSIVIAKSKTTVRNPMRHELPSKAQESLRRYGVPTLIPKPPSSRNYPTVHVHRNLRPKKVVDQKEAAIVEIDTNRDDAGENAISLLSGLLDHSKSVVKKLLNISQSENDEGGELPKHLVKNTKQDLQIGSILGESFIPGMRNVPSPTVMKPLY